MVHKAKVYKEKGYDILKPGINNRFKYVHRISNDEAVCLISRLKNDGKVCRAIIRTKYSNTV